MSERRSSERRSAQTVVLDWLATAACSICGCTAERACPEGCGWDIELAVTEHRAVCTAERCQREARKRGAA